MSGEDVVIALPGMDVATSDQIARMEPCLPLTAFRGFVGYEEGKKLHFKLFPQDVRAMYFHAFDGLSHNNYGSASYLLQVFNKVFPMTRHTSFLKVSEEFRRLYNGSTYEAYNYDEEKFKKARLEAIKNTLKGPDYEWDAPWCRSIRGAMHNSLTRVTMEQHATALHWWDDGDTLFVTLVNSGLGLSYLDDYKAKAEGATDFRSVWFTAAVRSPLHLLEICLNIHLENGLHNLFLITPSYRGLVDALAGGGKVAVTTHAKAFPWVSWKDLATEWALAANEPLASGVQHSVFRFNPLKIVSGDLRTTPPGGRVLHLVRRAVVSRVLHGRA